jgi:lipid-binding SYLF domain-containing protein
MKGLIIVLVLLLALPCTAQAASRAEQQQSIQKTRAEVLSHLYKLNPSTKDEVRRAAGYAVFSSANLAAIFISGGYGYGVAHDNRTGKDTYMKMASAGVGLGVGVRDFRAVFIFSDQKDYRSFVDKGLDLSGQAGIAAKAGVSGGATGGAASLLPSGIRVYQLTETGLIAQVMVQGTKYWKDIYLNGGPRRQGNGEAEDVSSYNR